MTQNRMSARTTPYKVDINTILQNSIRDPDVLAMILESDPQLSKMFNLNNTAQQAQTKNKMSQAQIDKLFSRMEQGVQKKAKGGMVDSVYDMAEADDEETLPERMKKWAQGEEGTEYAEILPIARRGDDISFAAPKAVRSVARGTAELLEGAHGKLPIGENISPDAFDALMGMSVPGLLTKDRGTLGMFAGQKARGADLEKLAVAKKFTEAGGKPEEIWNLTGWMRGKDGKWRFEIPDDQMQYIPEGMQYIKNPPTGGAPALALDQVVDHQKLFDAYPELKGHAIMTDPELPHGAGVYDPNINVITMSRSNINPDGTHVNLRGGNVPLHEMQHAVQEIEGFEPGSNMEMYSAGNISEREAYDMYRKNLGEVEARNTEARRKMSALKRKHSYPEWTQDVKPKDTTTKPKMMASEDIEKFADGGLVLSRSKKFVKDCKPINKEHYRQSLGVDSLSKVRTKVRKPFK